MNNDEIIEKDRLEVKEILGFALDLSNLPQIQKRYGLKGALTQAMSMCKANGWDLSETNVYSVLATLDSDLEGMFPSKKSKKLRNK